MAGSRQFLASLDTRPERRIEQSSGLLICGFGVQVPAGAPILTWGFTAPGHFLCVRFVLWVPKTYATVPLPAQDGAGSDDSRIAARRSAGTVPASSASHVRSGHVNRARVLGLSRSATVSWCRSIKISASFHHDSRRDNPSSDTARETIRKISFKPTSRRSSHPLPSLPAAGHGMKPTRAPQGICPGGIGFRHPQENPDQLGTDDPDQNPVATARPRDAPLPRSALRRHIPKVGAQCGSSARWDLRGGPPVRAVPTATIHSR